MFGDGIYFEGQIEVCVGTKACTFLYNYRVPKMNFVDVLIGWPYNYKRFSMVQENISRPLQQIGREEIIDYKK